MSDSGKRVVLIGKPGQAEQRMQGMLADGGVDVALSLDPVQGDPAQIVEAAPDAVVVLLEPGIEEALERYQGLLRDRALTVIYDEAELTLSRQGWDAARWMRHLLAKLHHHDDVLPPRLGEGSTAVPQRAAAQDTAPLQSEPAFANDQPTALVAETSGDSSAPADPAFDIDTDTDTVAGLDIEPLSLVDSDLPDEVAADAGTESPDADDYAWKPREFDLPADAPAGLDELLRTLQAEPAAESPPPADTPTGAEQAPAPAVTPVAPAFDLSNDLSLVDFDAAPPAAPEVPSESPPLDASRNLDDLESRIAHLQLVDAEEGPDITSAPDAVATPATIAAAPLGAVWILAGIGGPDAVRHMLSGLPAEFDRPLLIRQKLEGARHDKLVQQLERISPLPVELAKAEADVGAGKVYVLATGTGVNASAEAGWQFRDDGDDMPTLDADQAARCAVVVLSGADPEQTAALAGQAAAGALLLAQTPDSCFDAQGPDRAIALGAHPIAPDQIAGALSNWAILGVRP